LALDRLPTLLLRLGPQVDWTDEKECFRSIAREIAFAHVPPSAGNEARDSLDGIEQEARAEEHFNVQHVWFSAMRRVPWVAPKQVSAAKGCASSCVAHVLLSCSSATSYKSHRFLTYVSGEAFVATLFAELPGQTASSSDASGLPPCTQ
jgi:hypothetical protein